MKLTNEQLLAAKNAKSAEELGALVKEWGIEASEADIEKVYAVIHKTGEISDNELDNVAGGGCDYDHPEMVCPSCGHVGMDEELCTSLLKWCYVCPSCEDNWLVDGMQYRGKWDRWKTKEFMGSGIDCGY